MSLIVPTVSVDPGPDWANNLNASLSIIDQHNHSSGSGVQISQNGISLTSSAAPFNSLAFNTTNAYGLRGVKFAPQGSPLALSTDIGMLYESGVDLYYNDGSGNQIRITSAGSVTGATGTISGLPSGTASASYSAGTFIFQSATSTAANIDGASYVFRNSSASSYGITVQPTGSLAASYSLTLPLVPAATSFLQIDTSGNITGSIAVTAGITASNIANATITATQIANATITGTQIATNVNLPGNAVQAGGSNVVTSSVNTTKGFAIIRGYVAANGTIAYGEGFTVGHSTTGEYVLNWTTSFNDTPVTVVCTDGTTGIIAGVYSNGPTASAISTATVGGTSHDNAFAFIAIGQHT